MSAEEKEDVRSLRERLRLRITNSGPISFRDWMQAALYDEPDGYYSRADLIRQGKKGDYRTAPETSALFAETFARYFASLFLDLGSPDHWTIVEFGSGRGEFALGVLRTLRLHFPQIFSATNYVITEVSSVARSDAAKRLSEFDDRIEFKDSVEHRNPADVGIVFSNELIDAFPVHRVTFHRGELRELYVGLDQDQFVWIESDPDPRLAEYCRSADLQLAEGQIIEINLEAEAFIGRAAQMFRNSFVITVDYGAERNELLHAPPRFHGTLRAFHRHQLSADVLSHPGEQDLTTTIDWTQLREAGERCGLKTVRLERLDRFLLEQGILELLSTAADTLSNAEFLRLTAGARDLILPTGLAAAFEVLVQRKTAGPSV